MLYFCLSVLPSPEGRQGRAGETGPLTGEPRLKPSFEDVENDKQPSQWWAWVTLLGQSCRFEEVYPFQYLVISEF